jgi:hypothetical protein
MNQMEQINAIKIQKWFRSCILRLHRLPLIMYKCKKVFTFIGIYIFNTK